MRQFAQQARRCARGFSLAECAVVAIIFALLMGAVLQRLSAFQAQAERAAIDNMVANLRVALVLRAGHLQAIGKPEQIRLLAGQNPMLWLATKPPNYVGEYFSPVPRDVPQGSWYFNNTNRHLTYLLHTSKIFPQGTICLVQYAVELVHLPADNVRALTASDNRSVALVQIER